MRWHRISEELIELTLEAPAWEEQSIGDRMNRRKRVGNRFLRVTFKDEAERTVVITAVFKQRPPRGREDL